MNRAMVGSIHGCAWDDLDSSGLGRVIMVIGQAKKATEVEAKIGRQQIQANSYFCSCCACVALAYDTYAFRDQPLPGRNEDSSSRYEESRDF